MVYLGVCVFCYIFIFRYHLSLGKARNNETGCTRGGRVVAGFKTRHPSNLSEKITGTKNLLVISTCGSVGCRQTLNCLDARNRSESFTNTDE